MCDFIAICEWPACGPRCGPRVARVWPACGPRQMQTTKPTQTQWLPEALREKADVTGLRPPVAPLVPVLAAVPVDLAITMVCSQARPALHYSAIYCVHASGRNTFHSVHTRPVTFSWRGVGHSQPPSPRYFVKIKTSFAKTADG